MLDYELLSKLCGARRWLVVIPAETWGTRAGKVALAAWYAEKRVMMRLEKASAEVIQGRFREYVRWRLEEAVETLPGDSEPLAEVLEEILLIATGEDVIINWRPLSLEEARARIGEPLARP